VFEWHKRFEEGRESLQDNELKGRPSTSITEESTEVIQKCLAKDQTLSVQMLEEMIKRLIVRVHHVRAEFQESGPWFLLHDNAPGHSLGTVTKFW
jgi:transposase